MSAARRNRAAAVTAAVLAASALLVWVLGHGGQASAVPGSPAATPVVGKVTELGGTKRLRVRRGTPGKPSPLRRGASLRLGDVVDPGDGVEALIELAVPSGVSEDTELIYIRPTDGKRHDVRLQRTSPRTTAVQISG